MSTQLFQQAKQIVGTHILYEQNLVIDELIKTHRLSEEYIYPFNDEVLEWWLIDSWLAERLKQENEVVIDEYDCHWWGRLTSGQAIHMDDVIQKIAEA